MLTTCYPLGAGDVSCIFVHHLSKALVKRGVAVTVVAPAAPQAAGAEAIDGAEVRRFPYMWPRRWQKLAYRWGIPENLRHNRWLLLQLPFFLLSFLLHALVHGRAADILHAHWIPAGFIGVLAGKVLRKPVVLTVHGSDARLLPRPFCRWVLRHVSEVQVVSVEMQEVVRSLGREGRLIPMSVDEDLFNPRVDAAPVVEEFGLGPGPVVTFVARLYEFRDPLAFVRAMPLIAARRPDVRFVIVGEGPLKPEVERLAQALGVRERLVLAGERNDVHLFLKASSAFLALSPVDNVWTCAIAEAMLVGVPCIMTDSGHTGGFFTHGQNCYLVPPHDDQALADAVLSVLSDRELATRLVEGANRLLVEKERRAETVLKRTLDLYEQALAGQERRRP